MASNSEIRQERLKKLETLKNSGEASYPLKIKRTHTAKELLAEFKQLAKSEKEVIAAGRIKSIREHGGSTFFHVEDGTGAIQAYIKVDRVGEKAYQFFLDTFDIGDIVQVRGILFLTKRGEKTI